MSAPMQPVIRVGHKPHPIDRKRYGQPRVAVFWASRRQFVKPGVYLWAFSRQFRVLPIPRSER